MADTLSVVRPGWKWPDWLSIFLHHRTLPADERRVWQAGRPSNCRPRLLQAFAEPRISLLVHRVHELAVLESLGDLSVPHQRREFSGGGILDVSLLGRPDRLPHLRAGVEPIPGLVCLTEFRDDRQVAFPFLALDAPPHVPGDVRHRPVIGYCGSNLPGLALKSHGGGGKR